MGTITYYVAASLDGYIERADGSFDGFEWDDDVVADFTADLEQFDTVLMGRRTYEVGLRENVTSPYPNMRQIVFSTTITESPDPAVEIVADDIVEFATELRDRPNHNIWLCGGADIAGTLMAARLVDRLIVKLNPVVFGSGLPLVSDHTPLTQLRLESTKTYDCGITLISYACRP